MSDPETHIAIMEDAHVNTTFIDDRAVEIKRDKWVVLRCAVCEMAYEPDSAAWPQRFTCDGCGAVNVVQP